MLFLTTKLWDRHYENDCIHCVHFLEKENWTSDRLHNLSKLQTSNLVMSSPPECLLRINPSELNRNKKWACLCSVALSCWGLRCPWTEKESSVCAHAKWDKYQGISGHWSPRYPPIQIHCSRCVLLWIRFLKKKKCIPSWTLFWVQCGLSLYHKQPFSLLLSYVLWYPRRELIRELICI